MVLMIALELRGRTSGHVHAIGNVKPTHETTRRKPKY